jgi:dTDP-4-amino-4,6-dideoxygalactose transaminase
MGRDVPFHRPSITEDDVAAVAAVLRSGWITTGPQCQAFEAEFAAYVGARHAVALNSGTAALHLALEAVGVAPGDLVLVPSFTFAATAEVVHYLGARPVLVDCEPATLGLDLAAARRTLERLAAGQPVPGVAAPGGRVRAIVPMHYAGQACDVLGVRALARDFGLAVVEDAAHALPADFRDGAGTWQRIGSAASADVSCFSFHPTKPITTGEGGMLTTADEEVARRVRLMSLHGISRDAWQRRQAAAAWQYEIVAPGYKCNLTDVAAALGRGQLRRVDEVHGARTRLAGAYRERLADLDALELPAEAADRRHAWYLYVIRLNLERLAIDRAGLVEQLRQRGVHANVAWLPLHMHPYYRDSQGYAPEDFPEAARQWPRVVALPIYPAMTDEDVDAVVGAVRDVVTRNRR